MSIGRHRGYWMIVGDAFPPTIEVGYGHIQDSTCCMHDIQFESIRQLAVDLRISSGQRIRLVLDLSYTSPAV